MNPDPAGSASKSRNDRTQRSKTMNRYEQPNFRPAFGIAAAAMTALTLAITVVLPVTLACTAAEETTLAVTRPASTGLAAAPLRIEVVGPRATTASAAGQAHAI
jgi:hypothetical protein